MYDLRSFDNKLTKVFSIWAHSKVLILLSEGVIIAGAYYYKILPTVVLIATLVLSGYLWLMRSNVVPGNIFAKQNNLRKFFIEHSNDWDFVVTQYANLNRSSYFKNEDFVWSLPLGEGTELALMFTSEGGCLAWLPLERAFPHIVVDSLADNRPLRRLRAINAYPSQKIKLEGNFSDYFNVYQEPGKQSITLQILTPDKMIYLIDHFKSVNLEIQNNYLRLYAGHAQRSASDFQAFLNVLTGFQRGLKLDRINTVL